MSAYHKTRGFVASVVLFLFAGTQILSQSWANSVPPEEEIQSQTPTVSVSSNILTQDNDLETNTATDFLTNDDLPLSEASQVVIQSLSIGSERTYYPIALVEINGGNPTTSDSHVTLTLDALASRLNGDGNQDGVVDAADYVIWRKLNGSTGGDFAGDYDYDGDVDNADYLVWRSKFGRTSVITDMRFSTDGVTFGDWLPYQSTYDWNFSGGEGIKTIYVQVKDNNSIHESPIVSDTIFLTNTPPLPFLDVTSTNALSTLVNPWIVDLNGDGFADGFDLDQSLINLGNGQFQSGPMTGIDQFHYNFADFNGDGFMDLLAGYPAPGTVRYDNNQNNGFINRGQIGVAGTGPWLADLDGDGVLDAFNGEVGGFGTSRIKAHFIFNQNQPFPNDNLYDTYSQDPLLGEYPGWANGVVDASIRDFDGDGDQDVHYIAYVQEGGYNRRFFVHRIFRNDGNRQFTPVTGRIGLSGGVEFHEGNSADFNNDGFWDVIVGNRVYFGNGDLTFTQGPVLEILPDYSFPPLEALYADVNNDGFVDILTYDVLGSGTGTRDAVVVTYLGDGTGNFIVADSFTFSIYFDSSVPNLFMVADFDGDGAQDIYTAGKVFKNQNTENHWLRLKLIAENSNRDAIGAKITVRTGNVTQMRVIDGMLESERVAHFGLGNAGVVDELKIEWPNGLVQTYQNVTVDQLMVLQDQLTGGAGLSVPATSSSSDANQPSLQSRFRTPLLSSSFAAQKKAEEDDFGKWDFSRSSSRYRNPKKRYLSFTSANANRRPSF